MIPPERDLSTKSYYQVIRAGRVQPASPMLADGRRFFIGRAARSGSAAPDGAEVTEQVAEMRSLPPGSDQRSPARHPTGGPTTCR